MPKSPSRTDLDGNSLRLVDLMGDAGSHPEPDANRHARRLPQQSVPRRQRRRTRPCHRRCAERLDRRLFDRAGHGSAGWRRQPQPVYVGVPATSRANRICRSSNCSSASGSRSTTRPSGQQTPWESSSLTSDFYFFGDTAVAAGPRAGSPPDLQMAANLPSRSVRQAYDYVLSEGSPENYRGVHPALSARPAVRRHPRAARQSEGRKGMAQGGARELTRSPTRRSMKITPTAPTPRPR